MAQTSKTVLLPTTAPRVLSRARWLLPLLYLVLFALAGLLRLALLQPSSSEYWADTGDYLRLARLPLSSPQFWAGERVFGVPLFYKLVGFDTAAIVFGQTALAWLCWGLLALALAHSLQATWLRPLGFALVLAFSLARDIVQWDYIVLTESLTSSLFALLLGLWLLLLRQSERTTRPPAWLLAALALATLAWSFTRDTHAYALAVLALLIALALLRWRKLALGYRAAYAGLAGLLLLTFAVQNWTTDQGGRWQYPLMNVIGKRILVSPANTAFFAAHGMPTDPLVLRFAGNFAHAHGNAVFHDQHMAHFRTWLANNGKTTYLRFLLAQPLETASAPLRDLNTVLRPPLGVFADQAGLRFPAWVHQLTGIVYPRPVETLLAALAGLLVLAAVLALRGRARATWLAPLALVLLAYPLMLVIWHADAHDVGRHSYLVGLQLRLAGWLLMVLLLDALLVKPRAEVQR